MTKAIKIAAIVFVLLCAAFTWDTMGPLVVQNEPLLPAIATLLLAFVVSVPFLGFWLLIVGGPIALIVWLIISIILYIKAHTNHLEGQR